MIDVQDVYEMMDNLPRIRMNPRNEEGFCIYTGEDGSHCIAGEMLTRWGLHVPEFGTNDNKSMIFPLLRSKDWKISPDACYLLDELQREADQGTQVEDIEAWGHAIDNVKSRNI